MGGVRTKNNCRERSEWQTKIKIVTLISYCSLKWQSTSWFPAKEIGNSYSVWTLNDIILSRAVLARLEQDLLQRALL